MTQTIQTRKKSGNAPLAGGRAVGGSRARQNSREANHKKAWAAYLKVRDKYDEAFRALAKM